MKSKSNILNHFLTFKAIAELTLYAKIERFRLDNGGEYIGGAFQQALAQAGIQHKFNQIYTPR